MACTAFHSVAVSDMPQRLQPLLKCSHSCLAGSLMYAVCFCWLRLQEALGVDVLVHGEAE